MDVQQQLMRTAYDAHADALWSFCVHLTHGDRPRAEDLAQETLLRAWRHPKVLGRDPEAVRAWLFRVARNLLVDEWRSARVRHEWPAGDSAESLGGRSAETDRTEEVLMSWLVADALRGLSTEHRDALVECYYQGHSVREAAGRLGVPEGTVKSRLHYGLRALRLALQEKGVTR